jgi:hypothetical protein
LRYPIEVPRLSCAESRALVKNPRKRVLTISVGGGRLAGLRTIEDLDRGPLNLPGGCVTHVAAYGDGADGPAGCHWGGWGHG